MKKFFVLLFLCAFSVCVFAQNDMRRATSKEEIEKIYTEQLAKCKLEKNKKNLTIVKNISEKYLNVDMDIVKYSDFKTYFYSVAQ